MKRYESDVYEVRWSEIKPPRPIDRAVDYAGSAVIAILAAMQLWLILQ